MTALLASVKNTDIYIEYLGILSMLNIPDFDYKKLSQTYRLVDFICGQLQSLLSDAAPKGARPVSRRGSSPSPQPVGNGSENDDMLLSLVVWIGNITEDDGILDEIAQSPLITLLCTVMRGQYQCLLILNENSQGR